MHKQKRNSIISNTVYFHDVYNSMFHSDKMESHDERKAHNRPKNTTKLSRKPNSLMKYFVVAHSVLTVN